ncbi:unnamed protein product [Orchesella dallaii]|uniref:TOG domain-containing protein n=1 Tax=Orchesella dallaii TaxID=48710 RepID=A0ABP1QGT7_9HEXA
MSKPPNGVSFEEFRNKSWHDVYNMQGEDDPYRNNYSRNIPVKRINNEINFNGFNNINNNNSSNGLTRLPPPMEPREYLMPNHNLGTGDFAVIPNWWNAKILGEAQMSLQSQCESQSMPMERRHNLPLNANYIMPSSIVPVTLARPVTFLPPPTAYRDDVREPRQFYHCTNDISNGYAESMENNSEIIEIKRPGTVTMSHKESECGLACGMSTLGLQGDYRTTNSTTKPGEDKLSDKITGRMRTGLFDLPEVYSPPPLRPPTQRHKLTLPSPRAQQLDCIMPSFVENTTSSPLPSSTLATQSGSKPRQAYSEPIMKTADRKDSGYGSASGPETNCGSRNIKTPFSTMPSLNSKLKSQAGQCSSHNSTFSAGRQECKNEKRDPYPAPGRRACGLMQERRSDPRLNDEVGAGDAIVASKLTNHNCLSPRARAAIQQVQACTVTSGMADSVLADCLTNLKSHQWEENYDAFSQIYSVTEIHPSRVRNVLNKIIWTGLPHLNNPRTKLARMACICFKRLFQTQKRSMEVEGEKVFYRLLDLCGAMSNSFIQHECKDALIAAVENIDPLKSVSFLELHGAKHKNPHVREFAAYLLNSIMDELPTSRLMNKEFSARIIPMIVGFLKEGLLQTRLTAKLALEKIYDHSTFESKLRRFVSPENVRHISDTLREFRVRN